MRKFISIVLTEDGHFCAAPFNSVTEGDFVSMEDNVCGKNPKKVLSVTTDFADGEHTMQIEKYIGYPLPRITERYAMHTLNWEDE